MARSNGITSVTVDRITAPVQTVGAAAQPILRVNTDGAGMQDFNTVEPAAARDKTSRPSSVIGGTDGTPVVLPTISAKWVTPRAGRPAGAPGLRGHDATIVATLGSPIDPRQETGSPTTTVDSSAADIANQIFPAFAIAPTLDSGSTSVKASAVQPVTVTPSAVTSPFTIIDPAQSGTLSSAITAAMLGTTPGITADPNSLVMTAGSSSAMFYDGSLTALGIGSGILITSGTEPTTENTVGYFGQDNAMVGDPALDAVVNTVFATVSYDATTIGFSINITDPAITAITFNVVFGTDEYPEWVDQFVDIGVVLVNGVNYAYFNNDPLAPLSVVHSNLNAGYFLDNTANLDATGVAIPGVPSTYPIEYDGISQPLKIIAPIHQGVNNIEIGIADTGDHIYDSGLFISNLSGTNAPGSGTLIDVPCSDGDDDLTGTVASEYYDAKGGNDTIHAGGGDDIVLGGSGNDTLYGEAGSNYIDGGSGQNEIFGGADNDTFQHVLGVGVDNIDGGTGINILELDLSSAVTGESVDMASPETTHTLSDGSTFINVQVLNALGSNSGDTLTGGAYNDQLKGAGGDDTLTGAGADDQLTGGDGADTAVYGGNSGDYVVSTLGVDLYQVEDTRVGAPDGIDTVSGVEMLLFADGTLNLQDLVATGVTIFGTVDDDIVSLGSTVLGQPLPTNNGDVVFGNAGDDKVTGGGGADTIYGEANNDFLYGGGGNDIIEGGTGHDEMTGDAGSDMFVYTGVSDSPTGAPDIDVILDFSQAEGDKIDLSAIGFFDIVPSLTGVAGEMTVTHSGDGYLVAADVDGDGVADMAFQVDTPALLVSSDIITAPCYCRGTLILTDRGEMPIEDIAIGDHVMTLSGKARPIKWIGRRAYDGRFIAGNNAVLPIRIAAGAIADGVPARDLFVSPEHALYLDGSFLPARLLVNGAGISQVETVDRVEYLHIELDTHDIVFAEGATAETFVDFGGRLHFHNSAEFAALYPHDVPGDWDSYAALLDQGRASLPQVRAALLARAERLGWVGRDPELHLIADGAVVRPQSVADRTYRFTVPADARHVTIASRSVVPADTETDSLDPRRLGVPVERVVLNGDGVRIMIGQDCPALCDGFHANEGSHRWTDGRGVLPPQLLACFAGELTIDVQVGATGLHYPIDAPPRPSSLNHIGRSSVVPRKPAEHRPADHAPMLPTGSGRQRG